LATDFLLLRAVRTVIRADSDPARQALFANLVRSRLPVRLAYALHERLGNTAASAVLVSCYGLAVLLCISPPRNRSARILIVARHANARQQVDRVVGWIGAPECAFVHTDWRAFVPACGLALLALIRSPGRFARAFRIIQSVDTRYGFLVACRVAGVLAWYVRARAILGTCRPKAILVSSDSNPEEVGFASAARALEIPTVFISHAYPTPFSPPLDFTLSILEGEAEVHARQRKGPIRGEVVLAGLEGDSAPVDASRFERPEPVIGIFTPKAVSWPTLVAIVADCRNHFRARQIVVRWHPSMLEPPRLADVVDNLSGIVESSRTATLPEVARQCDWVIADENSHVHLPVLKLGIPTVAVKHLGLYPDSRADLYGFGTTQIVFPSVASVREVEPRALAAFFSPEWSARFERYDASYLGSGTANGSEVRRAMWRLFEDATAKARCA
jgi:hypothetical protein